MTDIFQYHITGRSQNKEWLELPVEECWNIFGEILRMAGNRYHAKFIAFVLMSNHFHLLLQIPDSNLEEIMNELMREESRTMGTKTGRVNSIFGGRYESCLIDNSVYFAHAYKYVYRNPVEAGICQRVEEYPFSTLRAVLGIQPVHFPVFDATHVYSNRIPHDLERRLKWLNTPYLEDQKHLRASLRCKWALVNS